MYCLELLQLVSIIVSLIYVILPFVMMGHVSICLFSTNQNDLRNKSNMNHLEPLKVYENVLKQERMTFSPIFLGITAHFTTV